MGEGCGLCKAGKGGILMLPDNNLHKDEGLREVRMQRTRPKKLWGQIIRLDKKSACELVIGNEAQVDELIHQLHQEQTEV
jgi:hypothetical protein